MVYMTKNEEICLKFTTTALSNFEKQFSSPHILSFLFFLQQYTMGTFTLFYLTFYFYDFARYFSKILKAPILLGWAKKKWGHLIPAKFNSDLPDSHRREAFVQLYPLWNCISEFWGVKKGQVLNFEFPALAKLAQELWPKMYFFQFYYLA